MNNEFINARDQLFLEQIKDYLFTQDVSGAIIEGSEDVPHNLFLAELPDSGTINIMYIPLPEDHFDEIRLLQFYAPILVEIDGTKRSDLLSLLNEVNYTCPLGSFAISNKKEIGFKYVFPINRFDFLEETPFLEIFNVYLDCLTSMRGAITDVNEGKLSLEDALNSLMN